MGGDSGVRRIRGHECGWSRHAGWQTFEKELDVFGLVLIEERHLERTAAARLEHQGPDREVEKEGGPIRLAARACHSDREEREDERDPTNHVRFLPEGATTLAGGAAADRWLRGPVRLQ